MRNNISIVLLLMCLTVIRADAARIVEADSAYLHKNFRDAAALYEETLVKEGISAGLLFNLGNTYYRLGKDGEAMVCYERARRLDPGNREIQQNIEFLGSKIIEANKGELKGKPGNIEPDQETFIDGLYRLIAIDHSSNGWAVFAVIAFILFLGSSAMYVFTANVLARKTGFFSGIAFLAFTAIFLIFAYLGAAQYENKEEAVIMDFTVTLLQQPENTAKNTSSPLHKGTRLRILEVKEDDDGTEWLKVRLNADNIGWLKKQSVEII